MEMEKSEGHFLCLNAPAKVNLCLQVLAKRPDGYHELATWMQKLSLYDRIELTLSKTCGIRLQCSRDDLPADPSNLAWKAAAAFLSVSGHGSRYGVDIHLEKNIPMAAGLGGGSSDAGTVLKGLNLLFKNEFSGSVLLDMARRLGADVPFFATDYDAVWATGIGDKMVAIPSLVDHTFLLVNPGFSVSTRWVYEKFALTMQEKKSKLPGFRKSDIGILPLEKITNDLEKVTLFRYPELGEIKKKLRDEGAVAALMSGSGPTVFGIFPDGTTAYTTEDFQGLAQKLRREYGDEVFVVRAVAGA
jgi:4-diphosphocytidyl-2-C-methyl-D-erythritol kinase